MKWHIFVVIKTKRSNSLPKKGYVLFMEFVRTLVFLSAILIFYDLFACMIWKPHTFWQLKLYNQWILTSNPALWSRDRLFRPVDCKLASSRTESVGIVTGSLPDMQLDLANHVQRGEANIYNWRCLCKAPSAAFNRMIIGWNYRVNNEHKIRFSL